MKKLLVWCLTLVLASTAGWALAQSPGHAPAKAPSSAPPAPDALDPPDPPDMMGGPPDRDMADMDMPGMGPGGPGGPRRAEKREMMMRELNLTADQRDKIADIRDRQMRMAIEQRAQIQIAELDLKKLVRADKPDRAAIDGKIDQTAKLKADLRKAQVGAMLDMRNVLTPEQRKKLRDMKAQGPPRKG